jgi:hypothetical protein
MRASNRLASVSQSVPVWPPAPASLAAPLSARVCHGSSPTCKGSNSTHRRQSTLPTYATRTLITQHATTLCTVGRRLCRAHTGCCQPTLRQAGPKEDRQPVRRCHRYPCKFLLASPARNHRAATKKTQLQNRSFSGPQHSAPAAALFRAATPALLSDIITVTNICYSFTWVSPWIPTSHIGDPDSEQRQPTHLCNICHNHMGCCTHTASSDGYL